MQLKELFGVLYRRRVIIGMLMFLAAAISVITYIHTDKTFESTATLMINTDKGDIDLNDVMANSIIAKGKNVLGKVISQQRLDMTSQELEKKIKVETEVETQILKITVEDSNPQRAQSIANHISTIFQKEIQNILNVNNVKIVDLAKLPTKEKGPNLVLYIFCSLLMSLLCSIIVLVLLEYTANTIRVDEIKRYINTPIIGKIPNTSDLFSKRKVRELTGGLYQDMAEDIRVLNLKKQIKTILFTSPEYLEDQSDTIIHLASTLGQMNKKVLVIDCDFRNPKVHQNLNILNQEGLSNVLIGTLQYHEVIQYIRKFKITVITSGRLACNPLEVLSSNNMRQLLNNMEKIYDYIFLNAPPVTRFNDVLLMSEYVPSRIVIMSHNKTTYDMWNDARVKLENAKTEIVGIIVNNIPSGYFKRYKNELFHKPSREKEIIFRGKTI